MAKLPIKNLGINLAKMATVAALLVWMIQTGKLNLSQMSIFITNPKVIIFGVLIWITGPVLLGTWRWWLLLRGVGLECSFGRACLLQLIGFFFNTAMPGAVGGDIVKAVYIIRDQPTRATKTPALLTVLLDRIMGLIGLFTMGAIAALLNYETMVANPVTANLMRGLAFVLAASCVFLGFVFVPYKDGRDPFDKILSKSVPGFSTLRGIYSALRTYKDQPRIVFLTIGVSIVMQLMFMGYMSFIGTQLYPNEFNASLLPPVFPFGILVTAVPLAPGGLGVGHAAFDHLFSMVGLPGGANVFNIYTLSQIGLNLLCFIPYLLTRKSEPINLDDQVAAL